MATNEYGNPAQDTPDYDPNIPVYADTTEEFEQINKQESAPASTYIDPAQATVEGRAYGLLGSGSPLNTRTQAITNMAANQKGLLNTRGAAQAGTAALIDKAVEIAKPDAALYGNMAIQSQKADLDAQLNTQVAGYEHQKMRNEGLIQGSLMGQEQRGQAEIQRLTDRAQMQRVEVDNQWKEILTAMQMDSEERQALEQVFASIGNQLSGNIERILRDPNITNKDDAIESIMQIYRTQAETAAALLDLDIVWGDTDTGTEPEPEPEP